KKKKKVWPWVISILTLVIIGGLIALFTIPGIIQPANVEMIDVNGLEYEEAYSRLNDLNLNVKRETMYSEEVDEGYVIKTDPEEGKIIKEESEVTVYSSRGRERVEFGDYTGQQYEQVEKELKDKGYESVRSYREPSDRPEGEIITQVSPEAGEKVLPDEEGVIFEVSSGPPKVALENLRGMTQENATKYLSNNNLEVKVTENYSDSTVGEVISQSPDVGTEVKEGSTVSITVSLGPKEEPPRTEKVSVEVPFDEESEETEQQVLIYVDDMDSEISEVRREETITETTTFDIELRIEPGSEASYKVQRGDEVIDEGTVKY
ncbi:PASTA domain-containing protein, partial [Halobacillus sp. BBL2006]|uniref:PASTA domain-containing protein n=1 Tax=Halobacillus sp. BBL2006 TaxID=1543706 RepID=UPI0005423121